MERERKSLCSKVTSFLLAAVMMVSVIGIMPENVSAADMVILGKGTQSVQIPDASCFELTGVETYIQFKPAATGYVTFKASNISAIYNDTYGGMSLCNASKQVISEADEKYFTEMSDAKYTTITYGVKAKTTYYLRVKAMGGTQVTATFKKLKVNKKALNNRKKAKTISKGKSVKGVILAGDKKADWYKIKLTKSQKLKLSMTAKTSGGSAYSGIKVTFCKSNGKNFLSGYDSVIFASRSHSSDSATFIKRDVYTRKVYGIDAGTYYVKVEPYVTSSSGYYTLKWK